MNLDSVQRAVIIGPTEANRGDFVIDGAIGYLLLLVVGPARLFGPSQLNLNHI